VFREGKVNGEIVHSRGVPSGVVIGEDIVYSDSGLARYNILGRVFSLFKSQDRTSLHTLASSSSSRLGDEDEK
jgi:hypothetical protein